MYIKFLMHIFIFLLIRKLNMRHQILCLVFLLSLSSSIILCQDIQFIDVSQYLNLDNRGSFGDIVQPLVRFYLNKNIQYSMLFIGILILL